MKTIDYSTKTIAWIREEHGVSERTAIRYRTGQTSPHGTTGAPRKALPSNLLQVYRGRQEAGETAAQIAESFSVSRQTLFNRLNEYAKLAQNL